MQQEKLIIIDGNSYVHRAYHALPKLTDPEGNIVNAVYGFIKMLRKNIDNERPAYILVAFDNKEPTFRHKDYKEYKAHREKSDDELSDQFPRVFRMLDALNVRYIDMAGFEADDLIATFSKKAMMADLEVVIITSDKDAFQLVNQKIKVLDGMKNIKYDAEKVEEKFGVTPKQMVDYLALVGDASDNLPGVTGIGPVNAKKLLNQFGSLDNIYENLDEIDDKIRTKLDNDREEAYLTQRLVTLVEDIDMPVTVEDCIWKGPDVGNLKDYLTELNFKSVISEWVKLDDHLGEFTVRNATSLDDLKKYLSTIEKGSPVDIEFVYLNNNDGVIGGGSNLLIGIGIGFNAEMAACYIPIGHRYLGAPEQLELGGVLDQLKSTIFINDNRLRIYDYKVFYKFLKSYKIDINAHCEDIIAADYVVNPEVVEDSLKAISARYLSWTPEELDDSFDSIEIKSAGERIALRLFAVKQLSEILKKKLKNLSGDTLYEDVEMKVQKVLAEMELSGIRIDVDELKKTAVLFKSRSKELEEKIFAVAEEQFNINSSKQLARILFEKIGLEPARKTKSGYSTAEDVLHILKAEHALPGLILEYRKLSKLLNTYIEPMPKMINAETNRLHTTFNITGTATGRLSSTEPNLQNIPVRTEEGKLIRKAFIPEKGSFLLSADYSQIDLRVLAHISGDDNLIKSFHEGADIHTRTASMIYGIPESEVDSEMRKKTKAINFGIAYGMSSRGLSKRADMDYKEAGEFIEKYFQAYPGIKSYMDDTIERARKDHFVSTIFNRRRQLPEINSKNTIRRKLFERIAINTPIQGSSADIIKIAMTKLDGIMNFNNGKVKLLLQIHDELLFEVPESEIVDFKLAVKDQMENAVELDVPVLVDIKTGSNWRDMKAC